eukprot:scaffold45113_cov23-Tisochrysis_lutea.AAC.1
MVFDLQPGSWAAGHAGSKALPWGSMYRRKRKGEGIYLDAPFFGDSSCTLASRETNYGVCLLGCCDKTCP